MGVTHQSLEIGSVSTTCAVIFTRRPYTTKPHIIRYLLIYGTAFATLPAYPQALRFQLIWSTFWSRVLWVDV